MTNEILYAAVVVLFVIGIYLIASAIEQLFKGKKKKRNPQYYVDNVDSLNVSHQEFYKVLNFMLMYGIITMEQYTEIQSKGTSFTR